MQIDMQNLQILNKSMKQKYILPHSQNMTFITENTKELQKTAKAWLNYFNLTCSLIPKQFCHIHMHMV